MKFSVKPLGDNALLVIFDQRIDPEVLEQATIVKETLERLHIEGVNEVVPAYTSVAVFYDPLRISYSELENLVTDISEKPSEKIDIDRKLWNIPVCYDPSLANDLDHFLQKKQLDIDKLIQLHTSAEYFVYMRGFLPGFIYMGGLDERLFLERKKTPAAKVPEGSVAIGGEQTGVYAFPSPAGWHIIGRTPHKIFDKNSPEIMKIQPGDKIQFYSISLEEYNLQKEHD